MGSFLLGAVILPPDTDGRPECGGISSSELNFPRSAYSPLRFTTAWNRGKVLDAAIAEPYVILVMRAFPRSRSFDARMIPTLRRVFEPRGIGLKVMNETNSNDDSVHAFKRAQGVIAAHGGLLMHARACRHGTLVIEMQPEHGAAGFMPGTPSVQRQQYAAMGRGIGLRWHFYYPRVFPRRFHDKGKAGQIVVNLDEFARYVEAVFF